MRHISVASRKQQGFTLIEVLVVAPVVLLIIGAFIMVAVTVTGSAMRSTVKAQLQSDVLVALDRIEQDVRLSTVIKDGANGELAMNGLATTKNPLRLERRLIRRADCKEAKGGLSIFDALNYSLSYQVVDRQLRRQVRLDACDSDAHDVWQRPSSEILINNAEISLVVDRQRTGSALSTNVIRTTLTAERWVAGEKVSVSGTLYAKSLNIR